MTTYEALMDALVSEHARVRGLLRQLAAEATRAAALGHFPDVPAVRATLEQLEALDLPHHAREGEYLFPRLRERCPPLVPVLDRLEAEHARLDPMFRALLAALASPQAGEATEAHKLIPQIKEFVDACLGHMSVEEDYILPVAADFLTPEDWRDVGTARAN